MIFEPLDDSGGPRACVALQIPEASRHEIKRALAIAKELRARLLILCDTAEQADDMARLAARRLLHHRRVAIERAEAGQFGPLT